MLGELTRRQIEAAGAIVTAEGWEHAGSNPTARAYVMVVLNPEGVVVELVRTERAADRMDDRYAISKGWSW